MDDVEPIDSLPLRPAQHVTVTKALADAHRRRVNASKTDDPQSRDCRRYVNPQPPTSTSSDDDVVVIELPELL